MDLFRDWREWVSISSVSPFSNDFGFEFHGGPFSQSGWQYPMFYWKNEILKNVYQLFRAFLMRFSWEFSSNFSREEIDQECYSLYSSIKHQSITHLIDLRIFKQLCFGGSVPWPYVLTTVVDFVEYSNTSKDFISAGCFYLCHIWHWFIIFLSIITLSIRTYAIHCNLLFFNKKKSHQHVLFWGRFPL